MKKQYYIGEKLVSSDPDELRDGVEIFYFHSDANLRIEFESEYINGPYEDLNQLRKNSSIFKRIAKADTKKAQKVLLEKNISQIADFIVTEPNKSISWDFVKLLNHSLKGRIQSRKLNGIHYFDFNRMKVLKMIEEPDSNMVWKARVSVYFKKRNEWLEKESTFFPIQWDITRLFAECEFAFKNRKKVIFKDHIYVADTLSGIPVEIIIINNEVKSIYPLLIK